MAGIYDFLRDEYDKAKKAFGLIGGIKLKNDPGVKELSDFERNLYEKSLIYQSMKDAFTAPGRAYRGELDPYSPEAVVEALNVAGMAQLGGMPGGARRPGELGMTVWHGSPYKFDKFDMSKIGTGEGNQTYGHGLYMAESPGVADSYRDMLAPRDGTTRIVKNGKVIGEYKSDGTVTPYTHDNWQEINALVNRKGDVDSAISYINEQLPYYKENSPSIASKMEQAANELKSNKYEWQDTPGHLYKVDIPDEAVARMLDWDKPLSEQSPDVRAAIRSTKADLPPNAIDDLGGDLSLLYGDHLSPQDFLNTFESLTGSTGSGEAALRNRGIPGIRYLDGGSRAAGEGTSNFVLFDDQLPRILERNDVPTGLQPWAPGEANGLLGLPPAAPMRPVNPIGNGKKTFIKDSAHAQTIADNIYNLANASGLEVAFEKSPAWGSQYLTITHPDGRVLRVRVADHANKYGGNDVYIDPSSASVEEGISSIRNAFPELLNKMPPGQGGRFVRERAKAMQDAEMFMLKNAKGTKPAELYPLVNKIGEAKSRAEIARLRNELDGLIAVPYEAQAK